MFPDAANDNLVRDPDDQPCIISEQQPIVVRHSLLCGGLYQAVWPESEIGTKALCLSLVPGFPPALLVECMGGFDQERTIFCPKGCTGVLWDTIGSHFSEFIVLLYDVQKPEDRLSQMDQSHRIGNVWCVLNSR